jgi:hypothetical protein
MALVQFRNRFCVLFSNWLVKYELRHLLIGPEAPIAVNGMYPLLGDHSRSGIDKVDPRFVGSHARLCKSIQFLEISKGISSGISLQSSGPSIGPTKRRSNPTLWNPRTLWSLPTRILLTLWPIVPNTIRMASYDLLLKIGRLLYGRPDEHSTVQRVPFGLYIKYHREPEAVRNEINALRAVRQHTSIPVPEALDMVSKQANLADPDSFPESYLLITRIPGLPLSRCQNILSDNDYGHIANQLTNYVAQLRDIPTSTGSGMLISNTLGEPCRDPRIRGATPIGPFSDEAAFSQMLRFSDDPARRGHKIVFTHADLNPRNILISRIVQADGSHGWRVTGIVDWETAGYYPEYWEYTKAMFEGFRWLRRHNDVVHGVFSELGNYSREFEVERRSWESGDGVESDTSV